MKFKNTPIIKTDRLCLRVIGDGDREGLIELLKNEEIGKTFMVPDFKSREPAVGEIFASGFTIVKASAFEGNIASMRVMEKCGMVRTGEEESVEYRGVTRRCICYVKKV